MNKKGALFAIALFVACFGFVTKFVLASTSAILVPTSDGNYKQFLTSSGSTHYTLVDETPCNANTDYVYTTTTTKRDSYGINISTIGNGGIISQIGIVTLRVAPNDRHRLGNVECLLSV